MSITKPLNMIGKGVLLLALLFGGCSIALHLDMKKVDNFCSEMQAGLDVNKVAEIASKYDVGFKYVRDMTSVAKEDLGFKLRDQTNTWYFVVGAPMTMGEYACAVYHNNEVILSSKVLK